MRALITVVLATFAYAAWAQVPVQPPSENLMTLTMKLDRSVYRRGAPIHVLLVLRARTKGAYLPNYFGPFNETCESGFAAVLLTPAGDSAIKDLSGCAASILGSNADKAEDQLRHFVRLAPGATRVWRTTLLSTVDSPGTYTVVGEYLSSAYMMEEVARLPEVHGTMVQGRVSAKRRTIRIK